MQCASKCLTPQTPSASRSSSNGSSLHLDDWPDGAPPPASCWSKGALILAHSNNSTAPSCGPPSGNLSLPLAQPLTQINDCTRSPLASRRGDPALSVPPPSRWRSWCQTPRSRRERHGGARRGHRPSAFAPPPTVRPQPRVCRRRALRLVGCPAGHPRAFAAANAALVRWLIREASCSATAAKTWIVRAVPERTNRGGSLVIP